MENPSGMGTSSNLRIVDTPSGFSTVIISPDSVTRLEGTEEQPLAPINPKIAINVQGKIYFFMLYK
jgi:hypothetical protein